MEGFGGVGGRGTRGFAAKVSGEGELSRGRFWGCRTGIYGVDWEQEEGLRGGSGGPRWTPGKGTGRQRGT